MNKSGSSGATLSSGLTNFLGKLPSIINTFGSIYVQNQLGKSIRSTGRFEQRQLDFQGRMLELQVQERARELRKQAERNAATAQSIFAQRGVVSTVGTAANVAGESLRQGAQDVETLRTNQAFSNVGLAAERASIGVRTRLSSLRNFLNQNESAQSLIQSN